MCNPITRRLSFTDKWNNIQIINVKSGTEILTPLIARSAIGQDPEAFPSTSDSLNPPQYDPS